MFFFDVPFSPVEMLVRCGACEELIKIGVSKFDVNLAEV